MITAETYKDLRAKYDTYHKKLDTYIKETGRNYITGELSAQWESEGIHHLTNEEISEIETYEFMNEKPLTYTGYINEKDKTFTTWTGQVLGKVIGLWSKGYRSNFGDVRVSISVIGDNGITYYGTYYKSAGDYAHIKAYKQFKN